MKCYRIIRVKRNSPRCTSCIIFFLIPLVYVCWNTKYGVLTGNDVMLRSTGDSRGFQRVTNDDSLFAYSAYYDPRDEPKLRVFIMCTQPFINISYVCKVNLKTGDVLHVPGTFFIFLNYLTYKYKYVSGVIKCQLSSCYDDPADLESVSIFPSLRDLGKFEQNFTIPLSELTIMKHKLTVLFPIQKRRNTLTRCYAPMHHKYNQSHKIIWNIEISRLSGADKFIFYNYSISPIVNKVLRHYMKDGNIEVRKWDIPRKYIYYFGQMLAEHDCLMSEMFSAKYVLLADLDEIILPKNGFSVTKMADMFFDYSTNEAKSKLGSLAFRSLCFIRNSSDGGIGNEHDRRVARRLKIEPLLFTTYYNPYTNSKKSLVIPERTDRMCVHNACVLRKGFVEKTLKPDKEAAMLHYRDKPNHIAKNPTFFEFYELWKYSHEIVAAIEKRMKLIKV